MLEIRNLRKTYGKKVALKNFNYDFKDGIYGMLGANGAGKSTLMNLLTDNLKRDSGQIFYDGEEILKMGNRYLEKVGYMPQQQGIYENFSARMFLFYMAELKGIRKKEAKSQIGQLLDIVNLSVAADKKIGSFSGGMKQRVLLAQALLRNPKILILDEPTTGLDPNQLVEIRTLIKEVGKTKTVLLSTHIMQEVEAVCSRVVIINNGRLVADDETKHLAEGGSLEKKFREITANI